LTNEFPICWMLLKKVSFLWESGFYKHIANAYSTTWLTISHKIGIDGLRWHGLISALRLTVRMEHFSHAHIFFYFSKLTYFLGLTHNMFLLCFLIFLLWKNLGKMQNIILFKELPKEKVIAMCSNTLQYWPLVTTIYVVFYWIGGGLFVFEKIHKFWGI